LSVSLFIKNSARAFPIDTRQLRWLTRELLRDLLWIEDFDLGIYIVRASKMAEINQTYLQHRGSTDVITFDYSDSEIRNTPGAPEIHGELFICIDDAVAQARQFRTTWQSELARYVIHGILHLRGFDDLNPVARRKMKREENRLLKEIARRFPLRKLGRKPTVRA
jgi:probable rRNA maturation factor